MRVFSVAELQCSDLGLGELAVCPALVFTVSRQAFAIYSRELYMCSTGKTLRMGGGRYC